MANSTIFTVVLPSKQAPRVAGGDRIRLVANQQGNGLDVIPDPGGDRIVISWEYLPFDGTGTVVAIKTEKVDALKGK